MVSLDRFEILRRCCQNVFKREYYFAKFVIKFMGGNFPYVNVDIRAVVLPMSTHVNWRGVGGKKEANFGQRKL